MDKIFANTLNQIMAELGCNAKVLSERSGMSMAQISRYRNATSVPGAESDSLNKIIAALVEVQSEQTTSCLTHKSIQEDLKAAAPQQVNFETIRQNYRLLAQALDINSVDLARYCNYHFSNFSRICSGEQIPREPVWFVDQVSSYVATKYFARADQRSVFTLAEQDRAAFDEQAHYQAFVKEWLLGQSASKTALAGFFQTVDEFDFDEFFRRRPIGRIKLPSNPLQIPSTKTFQGIQGMEKSILSFLRTTAFSSSKREVGMYDDHPLSHCFDNPEFVDQFIRGVGAVILKGLHINIVHNIERPLTELMLGLESLIPIHMTGQVSSYYLAETQASFHHLLLTSGSASVKGESVAGIPEQGRYVFSKANEEVSYNRVQMDQIISRSRLLVHTFKETEKEAFDEFLHDEYNAKGNHKSFLSIPPVALMSEDLLARIMAHNSLSEEERTSICAYHKTAREWLCERVKDNVVDERIAVWTQHDFSKYPTTLSLSMMFGRTDVRYSYAEYLEHLEQVKEFACTHANYRVTFDEEPLYRNIQIQVGDSGFALISKSKAPVIHFLIHHHRIVSAIEHFTGTQGV